MATETLTGTFIAALARRRATGEAAATDRAAAACAQQVATWGARRVLVPDDPWLTALGIEAALATGGVEVVRWPAGRDWRELLGLDDAPSTCAITVPVAAAAERGTVLLASSPTHGRAMDAVGWWHLAVLDAACIRPTHADALAAVYATGAAIPSGLSLVSGPSRTSDVEKITTYGAHGALAEHVVVVS